MKGNNPFKEAPAKPRQGNGAIRRPQTAKHIWRTRDDDNALTQRAPRPSVLPSRAI